MDDLIPADLIRTALVREGTMFVVDRIIAKINSTGAGITHENAESWRHMRRIAHRLIDSIIGMAEGDDFHRWLSAKLREDMAETGYGLGVDSHFGLRITLINSIGEAALKEMIHIRDYDFDCGRRQYAMSRLPEIEWHESDPQDDGEFRAWFKQVMSETEWTQH